MRGVSSSILAFLRLHGDDGLGALPVLAVFLGAEDTVDLSQTKLSSKMLKWQKVSLST